MENKNDIVVHPAHYTDGGIETIDFIKAKNLNFWQGNAVKYISRAGKKNADKYVEDTEKAIWYLVDDLVQRGEYQIIDKLTAMVGRVINKNAKI